jgi:hypothetical protein
VKLTEVLMSVIIGVDPHKATHTAVAIDRTEAELAGLGFALAARRSRWPSSARR